jgi:O-succinylbenzoic acid--CoA ligase
LPRTLEPLPVPTGERVLDLLPRLARALAGEGPALLPVPAADPATADRTARALAADIPLADGEDDPDDPTAFVVTTSGSTGTPKGALLSVSALLASARATRRFLPGERTPAHWLLALPAHHVAGLQVLLRSLHEGTVPTVLDTALPFTAARFAHAVQVMPSSAPRFVSLVPTQLQRILADEAGVESLARTDAVLLGGAPAPPALLAAAAEAGARVVTTYGMSETCGGCVYDGRPLDGVTVTTDDSGRISLAGPMVAGGYRGRPGDPAFTLDATGRRRFRTDDVGECVDGRWRVVGRMDDVLISGGVKVTPATVESTLASIPGVDDVVLTGVADAEWGEAVVAVLVPSPGGAPDLAVVRSAVRDRHGAAAAPRSLILVDRLPLRGPGKPDRAAVRELALRTLAPLTSADAGAPGQVDHGALPVVLGVSSVRRGQPVMIDTEE